MGLFGECAPRWDVDPIRTGAGPSFAPQVSLTPSTASTSADLCGVNSSTSACVSDQREATGCGAGTQFGSLYRPEPPTTAWTEGTRRFCLKESEQGGEAVRRREQASRLLHTSFPATSNCLQANAPPRLIPFSWPMAGALGLSTTEWHWGPAFFVVQAALLRGGCLGAHPASIPWMPASPRRSCSQCPVLLFSACPIRAASSGQHSPPRAVAGGPGTTSPARS